MRSSSCRASDGSLDVDVFVGIILTRTFTSLIQPLRSLLSYRASIVCRPLTTCSPLISSFLGDDTVTVSQAIVIPLLYRQKLRRSAGSARVFSIFGRATPPLVSRNLKLEG